MKRTSLFLLSAVAVFGCQRDDSPLRKEINDLKDAQKQQHQELLAAIKGIPSGAGAARPQPQRPQRPTPQPNSVYAVDINGAPYKGAKDAKVTIVEAFEFA